MYQVTVTDQDNYCFKVKSKDYAFDVDMRGQKGISPPDTLLASLGTCLGVYIRKYFEGAKIPVPGFEVIVSADFSEEKPACFRSVDVSVDLKGAKLDQRRIDAMLSFIKNCPVHNTLKQNPKIDITIK
ncbi:MAG TPA: OsmC family protein [Candidatus Omnitrophota bacterium]|nr:OsmC family protein [Candidatus Omnitrophota bacterium]